MLKSMAVKALKGNWQTALLVTFFATSLLRAWSLVADMILPMDFLVFLENNEAIFAWVEKAQALTLGQWLILQALGTGAFLITPALTLGANHYFISRMNGVELGFTGLFSRMRCLGKAFLLNLYMGLKILAWSLLFIIPGVMAAIRYSMAPYYMAEDPSLSIRSALEKSKLTMVGIKSNYFVLYLSFAGWVLVTLLIQALLLNTSFILSTIVYLFLSLFVSTYTNGAFAAFFLAVSNSSADDELEESLNDEPATNLPDEENRKNQP